MENKQSATTREEDRSIPTMEEELSPCTAKGECEGEPVRPYWIPPGVEFDSYPEELKVAIVGLINPIYRALVLKAEEGLDQATGQSIVFLTWLEILDQIELGAGSIRAEYDVDAQKKREKLISRYMRTVAAKNKTSNLLVRIYDFRQKWGALPPLQDPLRPGFPR